MEADNQSLKAMYCNTTIELYGSLGLEDDLNIACSQMENMTETEFESFVDTDVHNYLHELKCVLIPYGLHVFGEAPENEGARLHGQIPSWKRIRRAYSGRYPT